MPRTISALALSSAVGLPQPWPVEESFGWYLLQFGWMINEQQRCKFRHQASNKKKQHLQWRCNIHGRYLRCQMRSLRFFGGFGFRSLGLSVNHWGGICYNSVGTLIYNSIVNSVIKDPTEIFNIYNGVARFMGYTCASSCAAFSSSSAALASAPLACR
jgi:hypothetical protein